MSKFNMGEIEYELNRLDCGCGWVYSGKRKNTIVFEADDIPKTLGRQPILFLTLYKNHARFTSGFRMNPYEKNKLFEYGNSLEDFTDRIAKFTKHYFSDFYISRKPL